MAREIPGFSMPMEASVDLSASQFCGVTSDGNGRLALPAANASILGVLQNKPASLGAEGSVMCNGVTKMVTSAAVVAGAQVMVDAAGKALTATAGNYIVGIALTPSGGTGEIISVLLQNRGKL